MAIIMPHLPEIKQHYMDIVFYLILYNLDLYVKPFSQNRIYHVEMACVEQYLFTNNMIYGTYEIAYNHFIVYCHSINLKEKGKECEIKTALASH